MDKKFRLTNDRVKALPATPVDSRSAELEFSDTEVTGGLNACHDAPCVSLTWACAFCAASSRS